MSENAESGREEVAVVVPEEKEGENKAKEGENEVKKEAEKEERWGFGGPASVLGPAGSLSEQPGWIRGAQRVARPAGPSPGAPVGPRRSEALPFGGMRPPSGPRGFRGGFRGGRGGFGGAPPGSVGAGPDLAKVKQELEKAKEQVEKAVREEQGRALAAHVAKMPRYASESDWLAGRSECAPSAQLKRKMEEVEAQEQVLQVSEFAASLRVKAEEKARAAALKLRAAEVQHFVKVREWQAGHLSPAQMIEKKAMEAANDKYKELVKGVPFRQFSSTAAMAFDYAAAAPPGGREIGDDERRAWTSTAFKTTLGEGLPSVLYTEKEMMPARLVMPAAVQEARLARGVTGEEEDAAIMGDYDSGLGLVKKSWEVPNSHLADAMEED